MKGVDRMPHVDKSKVYFDTEDRTKKKVWKHDCYSDYPGVGRVYDSDVGKYAFKHLRFIDKFDPEKVGNAVLLSQSIFFGVIGKDELPKKKNWKFFKDF